MVGCNTHRAVEKFGPVDNQGIFYGKGCGKVNRKQFVDEMRQALSSRGLAYSEAQLDQLYQYFTLVMRWKKIHNLTAKAGSEKNIYEHCLDSCIGLSFLSPASTLVDLGAGAGFPGIVAAILWPNVEVKLVEVVKKKCSFLNTVRLSLRLNNVEVMCDRAQSIGEWPYVVTRAAFSREVLSEIVCCVAPNGNLAIFVTSLDSLEWKEWAGAAGLSLEQIFAYAPSGMDRRGICLFQRRA